MNFTWDEYQKKLETYRKNRQNVPLEELKTKYASGYNKLTADLKKMTEEILTQVCTSGMLIFKQDLEPGGSGRKVVNGINWIIEKARQGGTMKEISRAVFQEFDIDKAMEIAAEKIWQPAWYNVYGPYWAAKCRTENGDIICDVLPGFKWDPECGIWIQSREDGTITFTAMLPPTMELIRKEEQECQMKSKLQSS